MNKNYTIYDAYSGDDVFTGSIAECNEWLDKIVSLYYEKWWKEQANDKTRIATLSRYKIQLCKG
jgi:hypothetical protein